MAENGEYVGAEMGIYLDSSSQRECHLYRLDSAYGSGQGMFRHSWQEFIDGEFIPAAKDVVCMTWKDELFDYYIPWSYFFPDPKLTNTDT